MARKVSTSPPPLELYESSEIAPLPADAPYDDHIGAPEASAVVPHSRGAPLVISGSDYEIAEIVTRTVLRQENGRPFFVTFESGTYEAPPLDGPSKYAPPMISEVVNLETGECQILIMNTVLLRELDRHYPAGAYVGRSFAIVGYTHPDPEKRYRIYSVREIRRRTRS